MGFIAVRSVAYGRTAAEIWNPLLKRMRIFAGVKQFDLDGYTCRKKDIPCVITCFTDKENTETKISPYLIKEAPVVLVTESDIPLFHAYVMEEGSQSNDKGFLSNITKHEKESVIRDYPETKSLFRRYVGAEAYLTGKERWCLWLENVSNDLLEVEPIKKRINEVYAFRFNEGKGYTKKMASKPYLFSVIKQPGSDYIFLPRSILKIWRYIPVGYMNSEGICADSVFVIPEANYYLLGLLLSRLFMVWVRSLSDRTRISYRFAPKLIYNTFPYRYDASYEKEISSLAKSILSARCKHKDIPLNKMYDKNNMPDDLQKYHEENDRVFMKLYGLPNNLSDEGVAGELLRLYEKDLYPSI